MTFVPTISRRLQEILQKLLTYLFTDKMRVLPQTETQHSQQHNAAAVRVTNTFVQLMITIHIFHLYFKVGLAPKIAVRGLFSSV